MNAKLLGAAFGLALVVVALVAAPAFAIHPNDSANLEISHTLGDGSAVICDATPANLDDTSVANTRHRWIECANPASNTLTVRIGGSSVGANAAGLAPGQTKILLLGAGLVPKCYASGPQTIQCTESY